MVLYVICVINTISCCHVAVDQVSESPVDELDDDDDKDSDEKGLLSCIALHTI